MQKLLLAALMFVLTGCGNLTCLYEFHAGGMYFCYQYVPTDFINTSMVEELVAITEYEAAQYYSQIRGVRQLLVNRNTTIVVTKEELVMDCRDTPVRNVSICERNIAGVNKNSSFIMMESPWYKECYLHSVLMHEILHSVDAHYLGGEMHSTPHMFMQNYKTEEDRNNTIEHKAKVALILKMPEYPLECVPEEEIE